MKLYRRVISKLVATKGQKGVGVEMWQWIENSIVYFLNVE